MVINIIFGFTGTLSGIRNPLSVTSNQKPFISHFDNHGYNNSKRTGHIFLMDFALADDDLGFPNTGNIDVHDSRSYPNVQPPIFTFRALLFAQASPSTP